MNTVNNSANTVNNNGSNGTGKKKKKGLKIALIIIAAIIIIPSVIGSISNSKPKTKTVKAQTVSNKTYNSSNTSYSSSNTTNSTVNNNTSNYTDNSSNDTFYAEYNLGGDVYTFYNEEEYNQFLIWIEEVNSNYVDVDVNNTTNTVNTVSESNYPSLLTSCRWVTSDSYPDDTLRLWFEFYGDGFVASASTYSGSTDTDMYSLSGNRLHFITFGSLSDETYKISMTTDSLTLTGTSSGRTYHFYAE